MQDSKFTFSRSEIQLMCDRDFFIQKSIITKKIISIFHQLNDCIEEIKSINKNHLPETVTKISGKISKGENYLGLPYLVLDNPRVFEKKDVFAFRSMFWWGNYFSFTLHLSGKYLELCEKNFFRNYGKLKGKKYLLCIHSEQWVHHLEKENYKLLDNFDKNKIENLVESNGFLKLSRKLKLNNWNQLKDFGTETLSEYLEIFGL